MPRPIQTKSQKLVSKIKTKVWLKHLLSVTQTNNMNQLSNYIHGLGGEIQRSQLYDFEYGYKSPRKKTIESINILIPDSIKAFDFGTEGSLLNEVIGCDTDLLLFYICDQYHENWKEKPKSIDFYWLIKFSLDSTGNALASSRSDEFSFKSVMGGLARVMSASENIIEDNPLRFLAGLVLAYRYGFYRSRFRYSYVPELSILIFKALQHTSIRETLENYNIYSDIVEWVYLQLTNWCGELGNSIGESLVNFQGLPTKDELISNPKAFVEKYQAVRVYNDRVATHQNIVYFNEHLNVNDIRPGIDVKNLV